jgi:adenosylhomocysteine nucleosidase
MNTVNAQIIRKNDNSEKIIVIISADAEWEVIRRIYPFCKVQLTPYGEWFSVILVGISDFKIPVIYVHGGWGKVAAAGSTQYAINRWKPELIINLGTCGGIEGKINRGDIVLADKTVIYDIYELMGDPESHIKYYSTVIDLSWLKEPFPLPVIRSLLVSGDRDLFVGDIVDLQEKYGAVVGDWESGAIAWVAKRNDTPCLILRGVTDLVGLKGGEAYQGKINIFHENTEKVMNTLVSSLPDWLFRYKNNKTELD